MRHKGVNHAKVDTHVSQAFAASRTGVIVACVLCKAVSVHKVPACQLLQNMAKQDQACLYCSVNLLSIRVKSLQGLLVSSLISHKMMSKPHFSNVARACSERTDKSQMTLRVFFHVLNLRVAGQELWMVGSYPIGLVGVEEHFRADGAG